MRTIIAAALLALPAGAAAQDAPALPDWDSRGYCERTLARTESASLMVACLDIEDDARETLRDLWDGLPPPIRRTCLRTLSRSASYSLLNACVEIEVKATRDLERRRR
jgi:hypothetical protein